MTLQRKRLVQSVTAGFFLFLCGMIATAMVSIGTGFLVKSEDGVLEKWLYLQLAAGFPMAAAGGYLSRKISKTVQGPLLLAAGVLVLGLFEAAELLRHLDKSGMVSWPAVAAPWVAAFGVLTGGFRPSDRKHLKHPKSGWSLLGPLIILAGAALIALFIQPDLEYGSDVVAASLTLDFTLIFPAAVYLVAVRTGRWPIIALLPAFLLGYAVASLTLPREDHAALDVIRYLIIPAELTFLTYLIVMTARAMRSTSGEFVSRLREITLRVLQKRVAAEILTTEISLLYYAFRPPVKEAPTGFTVHRRAGYPAIVIALLLIIAVETIALHVFIAQWSSIAAWILSALSVYAGIWLVGDCRALMTRVSMITSTHFLLRFGIRWEAAIPLLRLKQVDRLKKASKSDFVLSLSGNANLHLSFTEPIEIIGFYGLRKTVESIAIRIDDPDELLSQLSGPRSMLLSDGRTT